MQGDADRRPGNGQERHAWEKSPRHITLLDDEFDLLTGYSLGLPGSWGRTGWIGLIGLIG